MNKIDKNSLIERFSHETDKVITNDEFFIFRNV